MGSHKKLFLKASFYISIAIILSRILGMVREQYSLYLFGAGWDLDAYVSASKIPNVLRNLLGEGAFSAVFIAIFARLYQESKEKALTFANRVISYLTVISIGITVLGVIAAPYYLPLIHKSQVNFHTVVNLTSYIMPFLTFISLSAIFMGILNSWQIYFIPALAPFFGNVAYLAIVFFTHESYGVLSLALGFLGSSVAYVLVQIPVLIKNRFPLRLDFKIDSHVKHFFVSFLPVAFGMAVFQLNRVISNIFSSSMEGGNTIFEKSFIIAQLFLSVFITGISTVLLPLISREDKGKMAQIYTDSLRLIFMILFPVSIFFLLMGTEISSFIYKDILVFLGFGTGKISDETIGEIGKMLLYFSPGILCFGLITIVNRGFQGLKMFYLPVIGSVVSVTLNYILMTFLVPVMDLAGLPAAISIASFVNLIVLLTLFHMKNKVSYQTFFFTGAKSVIAGSFLFFFIFGLKRIMDIPLFWKTPLILLSGSSFYFLVLLALKEQDIFRLYKALKRRVKAKLSRPPQK